MVKNSETIIFLM